MQPEGNTEPGSAAPRYHSPLRRQRMLETRARIAEAARDLFVSNGFAGTTVGQIARRAGVSVQTIYSTFGSKGAIVSALLTQFEASADATDWRTQIQQSSDPVVILTLFARWTRVFFASSKETIAAAQGAATDPAMVELRAEGDRHRRNALVELVSHIERLAGLPDWLTHQRAVDRAWMLSGVEMYLAATGGCGWSDADYETWLADTLQQQLLQLPSPEHQRAVDPLPDR